MGHEQNEVPAALTRPPTPFEVHYAVRGQYQSPDATMTLREGLAEYYRVNPGLSDPATLTHAHSAKYFHNHDCTHVVFGTHTGPLDEGVNDLLTFFGVDIPYWRYISGFIKTTEAKKVAKAYTMPSALGLTVNTLRQIVQDSSYRQSHDQKGAVDAAAGAARSAAQ